MKIEETSEFITLVSEVTGRAFPDAQIGIWHTALSLYSQRDCTQALHEVLAESNRFLTPADVAQKVKSIRTQRLESAGTPPAPPEMKAEESWEDYQLVYLQWHRSWKEAVVNGASPDAANRYALDAVQRPLPVEPSIPLRLALELKGTSES